jgi:hypothetical protein
MNHLIDVEQYKKSVNTPINLAQGNPKIFSSVDKISIFQEEMQKAIAEENNTAIKGPTPLKSQAELIAEAEERIYKKAGAKYNVKSIKHADFCRLARELWDAGVITEDDYMFMTDDCWEDPAEPDVHIWRTRPDKNGNRNYLEEYVARANMARQMGDSLSYKVWDSIITILKKVIAHS